jgi:hypothetical protein
MKFENPLVTKHKLLQGTHKPPPTRSDKKKKTPTNHHTNILRSNSMLNVGNDRGVWRHTFILLSPIRSYENNHNGLAVTVDRKSTKKHNH